ncbi:MAG: hypothetical protein WC460_01785 [Patescibacteria group bacterium]
MKIKKIHFQNKFDYISAGEQDYLGRLKKYLELEILKVNEYYK